MTGGVETRIARMEGPAALPRRNGELVFEAPWEGRAFAMAIAAVDRLGLEWEDFRRQLIAAIEADPDRSYYNSWVVALEALLAEQGILNPASTR
jgi:nitrile hydratase accessory protein